MTEREEIIEERAEGNMADFMENGPGLRTTIRSWVLAKGDNGAVLHGGLGGFGHGRMWGKEASWDRNDPTYADAPYAPETLDDFGDTGFGSEINEWVREVNRVARDMALVAYNGLLERARESFAKDLLSPRTFTTVTEWAPPASSSPESPPRHT